jgi:hypothetical protein
MTALAQYADQSGPDEARATNDDDFHVLLLYWKPQATYGLREDGRRRRRGILGKPCGDLDGMRAAS